MHTVRCGFLLVAWASALSTASGQTCLTWVQKNPSTSPTVRDGHAMSGGGGLPGGVTLFGGMDAVRYGDTWDWSGDNWMSGPPGEVPARHQHTLAYDTLRGVVVLFGGSTNSGLSDQTWERPSGPGFWTQQSPSTRPSARAEHAMAYDTANGRHVTVLFGGQDAVGLNGQTWEWGGEGPQPLWTLRSSGGPSPRKGHALAYDETHHVTVLFGGQDASGLNGQTWEWDGSAWTQRVVSGPSPRSGHAMAYLSPSGTVVLFGGQDSSGLSNQTWEWNGTAWSQAMISGPSARTEHAMAGFANVVLFGGDAGGAQPSGETWELSSSTAPSIFLHPASQTVCEGTPPVTFNVFADGTFPLSYQWRKDDVDISGATASIYSTPGPVNPSHAGSYDVMVTNLCGSVISNPAILTVNTVPSIGQQPAGQTACVDDAVTFSVTVGGSPAPTYQWFKNDTSITGATQSSLTFDPVETSDAGAYYVKATNSCGMVQSDTVTLTVNTPVDISVHPAGDAVCSDDPVNFGVAATGSAPIAYQWRKDEADIPNATANSYSIASADPGDAGDYDVVVTNVCGPVISNTAHLAVDPARLYVGGAPPGGANSGGTWADAFTSLQSALSFATSCPGVNEIWVAAGVYRPTSMTHPPDARSATFVLTEGVAIYGGFAGGETQLSQRDPEVNVTTLSGDLAGNDGPGFTNNGENCYRVILGSGIDATAVLDGFRVTGGNGASGGGMFTQSGSPTVRNCAFTGNRASGSGGAVFNIEGSPSFYSCTFSANRAQDRGGGMANENVGTSPTITDCTFSGNSALLSGGGGVSFANGANGSLTRCAFSENTGVNGGGVYINSPSAAFVDCTFDSNSAVSGGGLYVTDFLGGANMALDGCTFRGNDAANGGGLAISGASPTVTRCRFISNVSTVFGGSGGGISNDFGSPTITNCVFAGNSAGLQGNILPRGIVPPGEAAGGGAIFTRSDSGSTMIRHCTIAGNVASNGGGLLNVMIGGAATVTVSNCILWGNATVGTDLGASGVTEAAQITKLNLAIGGPPSVLNLDHCCIQQLSGDLGGVGNFDADPLLSADGHLLAGSPCINAGTSAGAPASDLDGDPRPSGGGIDIGADELVDSDADGLPDWWETVYFGSTIAAEPSADADADSLTNLDEYQLFGSHPAAAPYYVDTVTGNASFDGRAPTPQGGGVGPKPAIESALNLAADGDSVLVLPGTYTGSGNVPIDFDAKAVVIRSTGGPAATTIDGGQDTAINLSSVHGVRAVLDGFTIINAASSTLSALQSDYSRLLLRNCTLTSSRSGDADATALGCLGGSLTMHDVDLSSPAGLFGSTALFNAANVSLTGALNLTQGVLQLEASQLAGPGELHLGPGTLLWLEGLYLPPGLPAPPRVPGFLHVPSVIRCALTGSGDVQIDLTQQLILGEGAFVDLSGDANTSGCADPSESDQWGTFIINGALVVRGATVQNTNFEVNLASFLGGNQILNNDIRLLQVSAGYGGEFLVGTGSTVRCNVVTSEGDRYLDLDPDPSVQPPPVIENNVFHVIIKQGVSGSRGELLELRSPDYDNAVSNGVSGAYELAASSGYSDTWTLERLEILPGAKVNLTNREGFDFNPGDPVPDTVYVRDLVIGTNGVLNTGLQRLYYQTLSMGPGAQITDIPVLGFSLVVIQMEDQTEFDVRVRARVDAPPADQPCTCPRSTLICTNGEEEDETTCRTGRIERIDTNGPDSNSSGVMDMRTRAPDRQSADSVAAKGGFARAGEAEIVVAFEYLFVQESSSNGIPAELIVYLSDDPDVSKNLVEVARVYVPPDGRDGSTVDLGGTGEFSSFYGRFPRGSLNFHRGTYIELELRGPDARVWIDNWDPRIRCSGCADLNGTGGPEGEDYLLLLASFGLDIDANSQVETGQQENADCFDSVLGGDRYVDTGDLLAWDTFLDEDALNACGTGVRRPLVRESLLEPRVEGFTSHAQFRGMDSPTERPEIGISGQPLVRESLLEPSGVGIPSHSVLGTQSSVLLIAGKPNGAGLQDDYLYPIDASGACPGGSPQPPASGAGTRGHGRLVSAPDGTLYQLHATGGVLPVAGGAALIAPATNLTPSSDSSLRVTVGVNDFGGGEFLGLPIADAAFHPTNANVLYVVPVLVIPLTGIPPCDRYKAAAKLVLSGGTYTVERLYEVPPANRTPPCDWPPQLDQGEFREIEISSDGSRVFIASARADNDNDWLLVFTESSGALTTSALIGEDPPEGMMPAGLTVAAPLAMLASLTGGTPYLYLAAGVNAAPSETVGSQSVARTRLFRFNVSSGVNFAGALDISNPECVNPYDTLGCTSTLTALAENPNDGTLYALGFTSPRFNVDYPYNSPPFGGPNPNQIVIFTTPTLATVPPGATWSMTVPPAPPALAQSTASQISCADLALPISLAWNPDACFASSDGDGDSDVDLKDFAGLQACFTGSGSFTLGSGCAAFNADCDSDVDLSDWAAFRGLVTGP